MNAVTEQVKETLYEFLETAIAAGADAARALSLVLKNGEDAIRYEVTCWNPSRTRSTSRCTRSPQQLQNAVLLAERKYRDTWRGESPTWLSVIVKVGNTEMRFGHDQVLKLIEAEQQA